MAQIRVFAPDIQEAQTPRVTLAVRRALPDRPVIGLIPNGKPLAAELLSALRDELRGRLGRDVETEMLRKPSAAYSISTSEANVMAARAHMVITGIGD
jgi:hypothetical protein